MQTHHVSQGSRQNTEVMCRRQMSTASEPEKHMHITVDTTHRAYSLALTAVMTLSAYCSSLVGMYGIPCVHMSAGITYTRR